MGRLQAQAGSTRWSSVEGDSLVAQLADEVDFWRNKAEAQERSLEELKGDLEFLYQEREISEAWRIGLVSQLSDCSIPQRGPRSLATGFGVGLGISLALWTLLIALAYAGFWLFSH
jgi:hypothetical protein